MDTMNASYYRYSIYYYRKYMSSRTSLKCDQSCISRDPSLKRCRKYYYSSISPDYSIFYHCINLVDWSISCVWGTLCRYQEHPHWCLNRMSSTRTRGQGYHDQSLLKHVDPSWEDIWYWWDDSYTWIKVNVRRYYRRDHTQLHQDDTKNRGAHIHTESTYLYRDHRKSLSSEICHIYVSCSFFQGICYKQGYIRATPHHRREDIRIWSSLYRMGNRKPKCMRLYVQSNCKISRRKYPHRSRDTSFSRQSYFPRIVLVHSLPI